MIIGIVVVDNSDAQLHAKAPYFAALGKESALEHLVRTVVRGPFGVTIVVASPHNSIEIKKLLGGFAVQFVDAGTDQHLLSAALKFAADYRQRWEKVMADAKARFAGKDDEDEEDDKQIRKSGKKEGGKDWANLKSSADVKVRGLARSFDRDGIILFPADRPAITLELQAQMVEAFGREQADKGAKARPIAQAVHAGERGYPVVMDLSVVKEVEGLPAETKFDDWLLAQLARIQDVPVQDRGATSVLRNNDDLSEIMRLLKLPPQS
jgi:hypothetical protein